MMTLTYPLLSAPISFAENEIPVLIIENPVELRNFLYDLKRQISGQEGASVLAENFEPIEIANSIILLTDILAVDFTTRKLTNRIYEEVNLVASNHADALQSSIIALNQIALQISTEMDFDVSFIELTDPTPIFKLFNFSVDDSNLSCVERLTLYIKLQQRFLKKKLVARLQPESMLVITRIKPLLPNNLIRKTTYTFSRGYSAQPSSANRTYIYYRQRPLHILNLCAKL